MQLETTRFGSIDVDTDKIVTFPLGIPGFEASRRFVLLQPDLEIPFSFLQSVDDAELSFIVTNPFLFYPDYNIDLSESVLAELLIEENKDVMVWTIVSIRESLQDATLNLLAPIVMNLKSKIAKQMILHDTKYKTKHPLVTATVSSQAEEG